MEDRYDIGVDIGDGKDWWYVHGLTTHDKVYELNRQMCDIDKHLSEVLRRMEGHKHIVITEDDVILYDEGMSLFHSDPF